jgi:hypothetical protein
MVQRLNHCQYRQHRVNDATESSFDSKGTILLRVVLAAVDLQLRTSTLPRHLLQPRQKLRSILLRSRSGDLTMGYKLDIGWLAAKKIRLPSKQNEVLVGFLHLCVSEDSGSNGIRLLQGIDVLDRDGSAS